MRFRKRIFCIAMVLLTLILDTSLIPFTGLSTAYCPRLCLVTVILIGLLAGKTQGIIYGTLAGLLLGYTAYVPVAFTLCVYVGCGLVAGFLGKFMSRFLLTIIPVLVPAFLYEAAYAVYYYVSSASLPTAMLTSAAIRIVTVFVAAQILYLPFSMVLSPKHKKAVRRNFNEAD